MSEISADDLYEHAPCGNLSTLLDGTITRINATLLDWLGETREEIVGRRRFSDLLTVGGRIYHETHYAPLLAMQGEVAGVALELRTSDGARLPVLVTSAVAAGADGQPTLVRTVVFDARDRRAYEQELLRARRAADEQRLTAERERTRLRHLVDGLQRSLLPAALPTPPGTRTAAHYHMASPDQVGGDFYDLFPLGEDRWGFFLGDVCGKGVDAAAVTALARYTLRAAAVYDPHPSAVLGNLNTVLLQDEHQTGFRYCTVVFGVLSAAGRGGRRTAVMARGGHPPALVMRADGSVGYEDRGRGLLVGVLPHVDYPVVTVPLEPGDTLLLYTDGLTEAKIHGTDERFGEGALLAYATGVATDDPARIVAALTDLLAGFGAGVEDDTALLAIGIPPTA